MELILTNRHGDFGVVGTDTEIKYKDTSICIGDMVEVNDCSRLIGLVILKDNRVFVHGVGRPSPENLRITRIISSHTELRNGDVINSGWELHNGKVKRFGEYFYAVDASKRRKG